MITHDNVIKLQALREQLEKLDKDIVLESDSLAPLNLADNDRYVCNDAAGIINYVDNVIQRNSKLDKDSAYYFNTVWRIIARLREANTR